LSIVEVVAAAHGGGAGLGDAPSGGADVWLSLPRAAAPEGPLAEEQATLASS
jgi:hypothetical protein